MGIFNREKRLERRSRRKNRRATRKENRAIRKENNGNIKKANKLRKKAQKLRKKATQNLFWDHVVIEQAKYTATAAELNMMKSALQLARRKALILEQYVNGFETMTKSDATNFWNGGLLAQYFGKNPNERQKRKFKRRSRKIANVLSSQTIYIRLKDTGGKWFGRTIPSVLNRPFSKNFRFTLDPPIHQNNVNECANTIIHEIAHVLNVNTNHPSNETVRKALRDPDTYAEFILDPALV